MNRVHTLIAKIPIRSTIGSSPEQSSVYFFDGTSDWNFVQEEPKLWFPNVLRLVYQTLFDYLNEVQTIILKRMIGEVKFLVLTVLLEYD